MAQTPQQRRANAKFDKLNEKKMGKPESAYKKKEKPKQTVSSYWLILLVFVVIVPLALEPLKLVPQGWAAFMSLLARTGLVSE